jgi:hypothetical protein
MWKKKKNKMKALFVCLIAAVVAVHGSDIFNEAIVDGLNALEFQIRALDVVPAAARAHERAMFYDFVPFFSASLNSSEPKTLTGVESKCGTVKATLVTLLPFVQVELGFASPSMHNTSACEQTLLLFGNRNFAQVIRIGGRNVQWSDGYARVALSHAAAGGVDVFVFELSAAETLQSIAATKALSDADTAVDAIQALMAQKLHWAMLPRVPAASSKSVRSRSFENGDMLQVLRMRTDAAICYLTGSTTGHSAVLLDFGDGDWQVCESIGDLVYWPFTKSGSGLVCHDADEWLDAAARSDYVVAQLRLRADLRASFNVDAAIEYVRSVEHTPYGWQNFLASGFDVEQGNLGEAIGARLLGVVVGAWQRSNPAGVQLMLVQGLNKRLNASCANLECIYARLDAGAKTATLASTLAMPEHDQWLYGGKEARICSAFVMSVYKAAGLFGGNGDSIEATEHAPKDIAQLRIFEPLSCNEFNLLPYCTLVGDFELWLPNFNAYELYAHMNERCASLPAQYERAPHC